MATLLSICQAAAEGVLATSVPATIVGNQAADARLLKSSATDVGRKLARRFNWQQLKRNYTFATVNGTANYDFPSDLRRFANMTIWDRDGDRPLWKVDDVTFQALQSGVYVPALRWYFTVSQDQINLQPVPTSAYTIAFDYYTRQYCETDLGVGLDAWAADTDVPRLDEDLFILGTRYRFLARHGLPYAEEKEEFLEAATDLLADNQPRSVIDVSRIWTDDREINVPEGSWNL